MQVEARLARGSFLLDARLEAPESGVVSLFGPSGCGKSTLVHVLAGLLHPESGRVVIGGETWFDSTRRIDVPAERRGVGCVFQEPRLFPHFDVARNLGYGAARAHQRERGMRHDEIVEVLALGPLLRRRPASLSGGERQRVAIGRALLAQPALLLLDEPFTGLDYARRSELLPIIEMLRARMQVPIVLVTHDFDDVLRLADHLVVMQQGRIAAQGSVPALSLDPALRSMLGASGAGAVVDSSVVSVDAASGLARIAIGANQSLRVRLPGALAGSRVRAQLLARDLILSDRPPEGLSVRNVLAGYIERLAPGVDDTLDVGIDVEGVKLLARITPEAGTELGLAPGQPIHVLVKAVSVRGHVMSGVP